MPTQSRCWRTVTHCADSEPVLDDGDSPCQLRAGGGGAVGDVFHGAALGAAAARLGLRVGGGQLDLLRRQHIL